MSLRRREAAPRNQPHSPHHVLFRTRLLWQALGQAVRVLDAVAKGQGTSVHALLQQYRDVGGEEGVDSAPLLTNTAFVEEVLKHGGEADAWAREASDPVFHSLLQQMAQAEEQRGERGFVSRAGLRGGGKDTASGARAQQYELEQQLRHHSEEGLLASRLMHNLCATADAAPGSATYMTPDVMLELCAPPASSAAAVPEDAPGHDSGHALEDRGVRVFEGQGDDESAASAASSTAHTQRSVQPHNVLHVGKGRLINPVPVAYSPGIPPGDMHWPSLGTIITIEESAKLTCMRDVCVLDDSE